MSAARKPRLTAKRLRSLLSYNRDTGEFHWLPRPDNPALSARIAGKLAGHNAGDYWRIRIDGRNYAAHRLAWLYVKGWHAPSDVDHWDGNGLNNRWTNLRACTSKAQNCQNLKRTPSSKGSPTGCTWLARRQKWQVYIGANGKRVFVGLFPSRETAERAYLDAAAELHGAYSFTERPAAEPAERGA
jgi:HNH endonuclease